ncbi:hypothetical protein RHECNPAF_1260044 [Rhizobium etli CNPAF512]|nr:hypothetical protein RHECNPAF_1260044 [Rhizobium etli CNPAF512]
MSIRAWINSIGAPEPPKPPIMTVAPSPISETASAVLPTVLSMQDISLARPGPAARDPVFWFQEIKRSRPILQGGLCDI